MILACRQKGKGLAIVSDIEENELKNLRDTETLCAVKYKLREFWNSSPRLRLAQRSSDRENAFAQLFAYVVT